MIRYCPNCQTERPLSEFYCEGQLADGQTCNWDLSSVAIRPPGAGSTELLSRPSPVPGNEAVVQEAPTGTCPNGHHVDEGDLICMTCGAEVVPSLVSASAIIATAADTGPRTDALPTEIGTWEFQHRLSNVSSVRELFVVRHRDHGREAVLELYTPGSEPDRAVQDALLTMPLDHIPELIEVGRWQDRPFEVRENVSGGNLLELEVAATDLDGIKAVATELGRALASFSQAGLRHRDLRPENVLIRTRDPLDLVVTGFGSARLSDFDLDVVAPLETTRYMAPEAIAGGVAAASDWWSLGMVLLELATTGSCFEGVNPRAFLIDVLTNGVDVPLDLDPSLRRLLLGLLARDHRTRWQWDEMRRWADGEDVALPPEATVAPSSGHETSQASIQLGGKAFRRPSTYALAAAEPANWDEARTQAVRGALVAWVEEANVGSAELSALRRLSHTEDISEDFRLALALKVLHPSMPLVLKGNIITPGWLLDHPEEATHLVFGAATEFLARLGAEEWLSKLRQRGAAVRARAKQFEIALNEDELKIHLLSTSRARLAALWGEKRKLLPDTDHPGLNSLLERRQTTEEDFILLLAAEVSQFRSTDEILSEAEQTAARAGVPDFDRVNAAEFLSNSRRDLHKMIDQRLEGFARSGIVRVDEWADQFRLDRRISLDRVLVLLSIPEERWQEPPKQSYVSTLLDYFSKKIAGSIMRGPLTHMTIGKTTPRVDLMELDTARRPASALLDLILARTDRSESIDPAALTTSETLERRMRALHQHSLLYKRDTGIDGLYMGFPFLIHRDDRAKPKIAPILLWPVRLVPEVGHRGHATIAFDREREEVRLNPAFEGMIGLEASRRWQEAANDLLGRATLTTADVVDGFTALADPIGRRLVGLPGKDVNTEIGRPKVACAATLFHLAYMGQAIVEDLRHLKSRPLDATALHTALKVTDAPPPARTTDRIPEVEKFFTVASDPSQEAAVIEARQAPGLLIEGPPGTGKSQTIVNMVADAIGRKKSLLVICQKQAALEVVKKRLEAEGLEDRIFMITDMNKDREPVLKAVRDQIESHRAGYGNQSWRRDRQLVAQRIESLEADLDRHHSAMHHEDGASGLSYRGVLGELLAVEGDRPPVGVPALRRVLAPLTAEEVYALEDVCGQNARLWLPSRYEGNALQPLKIFQPDTATVEAFIADLTALRNAENQRQSVYRRTESALPMDEPEPYQRWFADHDAEFQNLNAEERMELSRWYGICSRDATNESRATAIVNQLASARNEFENEPGRPPAPAYSAAMTAMKDRELEETILLGKMVLRKPSLFGRLNPMRWSRARALVRQISSLDLDPREIQTFFDAAVWELWLRPHRLALADILREIGEDGLVTENISASGLAAIAAQKAAALWKVQTLSDAIKTFPSRTRMEAVVKASSLQEYENLRSSAERAYERYEAKQFNHAALSNAEQWFEIKWVGERQAAISLDGTNGYEIGKISEALPMLEPFQRFRLRLNAIPPKAMEVFAHLRGVADALASLSAHQLEEDVRRIIRRESLLATKARLETETPSLLYDSTEIRSKVRSLAEADVQMRRINRTLLTKGIDFSMIASEREWEPITRLRGQRAQRLREFLEKGTDLGLMELRPVWLMNPDVASRVLPLRKGMFDIVIYDEASQMPVEYSLPSLYRGQVMIVSGDEKQMPPTAFFNSKVEDDEADAFDENIEDDASEAEHDSFNETWSRREIKDCPDLLQLAKSVLPTTTLQIHYRSAYRELIGFSNASFYANRLNVPVRHPDEEIRRAKPIEVIKVDGVYENQTNKAEAEKVIETLAEIWNRGGKIPTVGVVTFNRKQADLIEDALEEEAERNSWFGGILAKERDRVEGGEDVGLFVKNVENVQGDERDFIIFSSTFGRNAQGSFRRNFGVLGQRGGERRLNVAVTRARSKVLLITSIPVGDVSDMLSSRRRPSIPRDYLQGYLEYARAMSAGEFETGRGLLGRLVTERSGAQRHEDDARDGFAVSVAEYLDELDVEASSVSDGSAFGLDFAVEDPITGLYALAVECDAPRHHILANARAREIWRPSVLSRSIPHIHRLSCHGWYHSRDEEKHRLRKAVEAALRREAAE